MTCGGIPWPGPGGQAASELPPCSTVRGRRVNQLTRQARSDRARGMPNKGTAPGEGGPLVISRRPAPRRGRDRTPEVLGDRPTSRIRNLPASRTGTTSSDRAAVNPSTAAPAGDPIRPGRWRRSGGGPGAGRWGLPGGPGRLGRQSGQSRPERSESLSVRSQQTDIVVSATFAIFRGRWPWPSPNPPWDRVNRLTRSQGVGATRRRVHACERRFGGRVRGTWRLVDYTASQRISQACSAAPPGASRRLA